MKIRIQFILALSVFYFCSTINSYSQSEKTVSKEGVVYKPNVYEPLTDKEFTMIKEVYGDHTEEIVLKNPEFLNDLKSLLRNRIEIIQISEPSKQKGCKLLSEIALNNQYNPDLKRSIFKDVDSFNPLLYSLDFFEKGSYLYRIDDTNSFIMLTSQYRQ